MTRSPDTLKLLIVIYHPFDLWRAPDWFAERVRQEFPDVQVVRLDDYKTLTREIADTDVLMSWSITAEQLAAASRLKWIHSPAAAVHRLMIPELQRSNITITSARGLHGPVVAEHVIALVLAMAKRLPSAMRYQQRALWGQELLWNEKPRPREIAGATLGLVGLGSIGLEVARRAAAMDMQVIAVRGRKGGEEAPFVNQVYGPEELDRVLEAADYVVLAAPVTSQTKEMINAARLAKMKKDAYLINVARGALIDEPALVNALRQGVIAGAALDVFEHEPLAPESPLWGMENALITPHSAAMTEKLWDRHFDLLSKNLRAFLAGQPLLGVVDKQRGY